MTTCSTDLSFQTHTLGCNSKQMGSLVFVLVRTKAGCLMNFLWTFFLSGSIQGVAIWLLQFTSWSAADNCKEYNSTLGVCLSGEVAVLLLITRGSAVHLCKCLDIHSLCTSLATGTSSRIQVYCLFLLWALLNIIPIARGGYLRNE